MSESIKNTQENIPDVEVRMVTSFKYPGQEDQEKEYQGIGLVAVVMESSTEKMKITEIVLVGSINWVAVLFSIFSTIAEKQGIDYTLDVATSALSKALLENLMKGHGGQQGVITE